MVFRKKVYENIDEIIDFITNENDESDDQMGLGDSDSELESDWEYKAQPKVTFLADNVAQSKTWKMLRKAMTPLFPVMI